MKVKDILSLCQCEGHITRINVCSAGKPSKIVPINNNNNKRAVPGSYVDSHKNIHLLPENTLKHDLYGLLKFA